jgi:hypothetical protein
VLPEAVERFLERQALLARSDEMGILWVLPNCVAENSAYFYFD